MPSPGSVTRLLGEITSGDRRASSELLPLVYDELRKLARARMARLAPGQTLQPTALVHEAYLRLVKEDLSWDSRGHFFAAAAEAMRRILIERARRYGRKKHGAEYLRVSMAEVRRGEAPDPEEMLALDDALTELEARDPQMAQVTKLRYFAGLTQDETALALDISRRTVNRQWVAARAWLGRELGRQAS